MIVDKTSAAARSAASWHNPLPTWITEDPAFRKLRQGPKHTLQMIANRCTSPPNNGPMALLVCFGGDSLIAACGCGNATFWRHMRKLHDLGYIAPLSRGGGRMASIYGVPGFEGELDRSGHLETRTI